MQRLGAGSRWGVLRRGYEWLGHQNLVSKVRVVPGAGEDLCRGNVRLDSA